MVLHSVSLGANELTVRCGWHLPILAILALMFVIPHDPSIRIHPGSVGSDAFGVGGGRALSGLTGLNARSERRAVVPLERSPASRGAVAQMAAISSDWTTSTVLWLAKCALVRPVQTSRVAIRAAALHQAQEQQAQEQQREQQVQQVRRELSAMLSNASAIASGDVMLPTSVDALREKFGGRQKWWGDLGAVEGRELYHSLVPSYLLDEELAQALSLQERARLAVLARHAARLYVRERTNVPLTVACEVLDGVRQLWESGTFQSTGLNEEQVWAKYTTQYAETAGLPPGADVCVNNEALCQLVLEKACTTNRHVDELVGCLGMDLGSASTMAAGEAGDLVTLAVSAVEAL